MPSENRVRGQLRLAFAAWSALTMLILLSIAGLYAWRGSAGFELVIQTGQASGLPVTLASVALTWCLAGSFLYMLAARRIDRGNAFSIIGFYIVALVYLNILRERLDYGDVQHYIRAAESLYSGQALPDEYVYPPLWAAVLAPLVPLGETSVFLLLWLANMLSLFVFYFLLQGMLTRYEFSSRMAALTTTVFLLVNTPLLRTLVYTQVNLHMLNLVFVSVLIFRRLPWLSALGLALAVHLKASPIVLLLAFLLERDVRWLICFSLSLLLIGLAVFTATGPGPFLDFGRTAAFLATERGVIFRDSSLDGLFTALAAFIDLQPQTVHLLVYATKIALAACVVLVTARAVRHRAFDAISTSPRLNNSLPPLLILMTLAAPVVWEHHGLFLSVSFLLLLKRLRTPAEWLWFGTAWFLEFALPTFDFFPWSYGRLIAPLIALGLMWQVSEHARPSQLLGRLSAALERI